MQSPLVLVLVVLFGCWVLQFHCEDRTPLLLDRDSSEPEAVAKRLQLRKKDQVLLAKSLSIIHGHPQGANRTCDHVDDVKKFLPMELHRHEHSGGKYHLLLAVSDRQIAFLINWLAVAFEFGYLPSHRVVLHFACEGPGVQNFVENHLYQECEKTPQRNTSAKESTWRRVIKNRLYSFVKIFQSLEEHDYGALTFDVDAIMIRNMVSVFDHFYDRYDVVSAGTMHDQHAPSLKALNGKVAVNFGGFFLKNSGPGKALAAIAYERLMTTDPKQQKEEFPFPDQDYFSYAMFQVGKASQQSLPIFEHLERDSNYHTELCNHGFADTCTWIYTGVEGNMTFLNRDVVMPGKYLFFPSLVAPKDCSHICDGSTVLLQHCGIATCIETVEDEWTGVGKSQLKANCGDIPEFILKTHELKEIVKEVPSKPDHMKNWRAAPTGTFDSTAMQHQVETIHKFVSVERLHALCEVYSGVCKLDSKRPNGIRLIDE